MKIRAAKDQDPLLTYNDLRVKFGVSPNIIKVALEKTVDDWKAMLESTTPRNIPRDPASRPIAIKKESIQPFSAVVSSPEPMAIAAPAVSTEASEWEYRAIVIRSRSQFNDVVFEQQGHDNSDWKLLAAKSFEDVLNIFGNDKWDLGGMAVLSHGSAGFTGMYELVFKRKKT